MARTILREAPDLVDLVLAGKSLNEAYAEAQQRHTGAASDEKQLARLAADAPDLLELVNAERLTVSAAIAPRGRPTCENVLPQVLSAFYQRAMRGIIWRR